jgi:hypothetical protein
MAEYIEREKAEKEIFIKRDQERQYWMEYLNQQKGTKEYSSAEKAVDNWLRGYGEAIENILAIFDKLSVDVEPVKHGEWTNNEDDWEYYKCSICRNEAYWDTDYGQQLFDFCPWCGAKMDGKEVQE